MTLDTSQPTLARECARLHPHVARLLERAGQRALELHADMVTVEHLIGATMEDEDSAAVQAVEHAFADPETLSKELLALSPGIMVVGSRATLAFSPLCLGALEETRRRAAECGASEIDPGQILAAVVNVLPEDLRTALEEQGYGDSKLGPKPGSGEVTREGHLFRSYSAEAKKALSQASRSAEKAGEPSIGPARILLACLQIDSGLETASGLGRVRAQTLLQGRTRDDTQPTPRLLPPDEKLIEFLGKLAAGAGSIALLAACHGEGLPELAELLSRHKVSLPLLERSADAFHDPETD